MIELIELEEKQNTLITINYARERTSYSTNQKGDGGGGPEVNMLGWRQETPRWANELVRQADIMGQRRGTPR